MTEEESSKLQVELIKKLNEIYPDFNFLYSLGSSVNGVVSSHVYEYLIEQDSIRKLQYGKLNHDTFIHYTTLRAFCEILNSGEIRLFDLNNMNDPFEFDYLLNKETLQFNNKEIDFFKKRLFITSLCKYDDETGDDFNLWRFYGDNGSGIAVVFKLINPNENWRNYLISNVIYGNINSESEKLVKAIKILKEYIDKGLERIPQLLGLLLVHHKNEIWKIENECRLSTFCDSEDYGLQSYDDFNPLIAGTYRRIVRPDGITTSYVAFPLEFKLRPKFFKNFNSEEDFNDAVNSIPKLTIEKIILGYKLNEKVFDDLIFFCSAMASYWHKHIQIERSKYFDSLNRSL